MLMVVTATDSRSRIRCCFSDKFAHCRYNVVVNYVSMLTLVMFSIVLAASISHWVDSAVFERCLEGVTSVVTRFERQSHIIRLVLA